MNDILINFDAEKANELASKPKFDELNAVLSHIYDIAQSKGKQLYLYTPYSKETIEELRKRKFTVIESSSIDIQKSNLHYTIKW